MVNDASCPVISSLQLEAENIGIQEQALRNHEPGSVGKMSRFISSWYASFFTS